MLGSGAHETVGAGGTGERIHLCIRCGVTQGRFLGLDVVGKDGHFEYERFSGACFQALSG